jgi:hypothetical protein
MYIEHHTYIRKVGSPYQDKTIKKARHQKSMLNSSSGGVELVAMRWRRASFRTLHEDVAVEPRSMGQDSLASDC